MLLVYLIFSYNKLGMHVVEKDSWFIVKMESFQVLLQTREIVKFGSSFQLKAFQLRDSPTTCRP